jgi:probable O-glycosylation ligase (exosortase A-associated)
MSFDAFSEGIKYLAVFFLVANVVDTRDRARTTVHVIALSSVIPAVGAISSWLRGEHLVEGDRAGWIGIFANPNDLAHYLVVGIALALGGREAARPRWLRLAYLPALAALATAVLLTQSRGGLLAGATVLGLWSLRGATYWSGRGRAAVGVAAVVLLAVHLAPETTWQRAETAFDYREDASAQGRIDAWRTGMNVVADRPFTGVGAAAFPLAWPEYAPGDAGPARTAHNTFIQLVGETGLPALALFIAALVAAMVTLRRVRRTAEGDLTTLANAVHVGLIAFAVCSLTGGYAYSWPLYLLLGLSAAFGRLHPPPHPPTRREEVPRCAASTA